MKKSLEEVEIGLIMKTSAVSCKLNIEAYQRIYWRLYRIETLNIPTGSDATTVSIGAATSSTEIHKTELNQYLILSNFMCETQQGFF